MKNRKVCHLFLLESIGKIVNHHIIFLFFISENVQSVIHNTISKKDDWHNTIYIIKILHKAQDEGNHPEIVPSSKLLILKQLFK